MAEIIRDNKGKFVKGTKSLFEGKHLSEVTKKYLSKIQKGKHHHPETEFKKGIHYSPKTEFKSGDLHSKYWLGKKRDKKTINKLIKINTGRNHSLITIQKMRIAHINHRNKNYGFKLFPMIGKYEKEIIDKLEEIYQLPITRQFFINGYWLDGYCAKLNLAIEVDEEHHHNRRSKRNKDLIRQQNIMNALNCKFLRINEKEYINKMKRFN